MKEKEMNDKNVEATNPEKPVSLGKKIINFLGRIPASGILLSALAGIFFVSSAMIVKYMHHYNPFELLLIRSIFQMVVFLTVLKINKKGFIPPSGNRVVLFLRSFCVFLAISFSYYSYRLIAIGDATAITLAAPAFVNILACMLIGEACGFIQILTLTITLSGVALISKPTFIFHPKNLGNGASMLVGTLCALMSAVALAFSSVLMKKLSKCTPSLIVLWSALFNLVVCTVIMLVVEEVTYPYDLEEVSVLVLFVACNLVGQYLIALSYRFDDAGPITLARAFDVLLSFSVQVLFFHVPMGLESIVGSTLIFSGLLIAVLYRYYKQSPDMFSCLMPNKGVKKFCKEYSKKVDKGITIISIKEVSEVNGERY